MVDIAIDFYCRWNESKGFTGQSKDRKREQIVQYNRIRKSLLAANDINLAVISIGLPEKGQQLTQHLQISDGIEWIFVDPDNKTYDALQLNSGVGSTFASIETPFAFRDRIFGMNGRKDGMGDLQDVLGKWGSAVYIPPKQEQAFQQGGAFIFKGGDTVFAHYDASAGAHVEVGNVVERAIEIVNQKQFVSLYAGIHPTCILHGEMDRMMDLFELD